MNAPKMPKPRVDEEISKSRALRASLITLLGLVALIALFIHAKWSVRILINKTYGNIFNNLAMALGLFAVHAGLSFRLLYFLNMKYVDSQIDDDHLKYH